jgi:hypothetical protein
MHVQRPPVRMNQQNQNTELATAVRLFNGRLHLRVCVTNAGASNAISISPVLVTESRPYGAI